MKTCIDCKYYQARKINLDQTDEPRKCLKNNDLIMESFFHEHVYSNRHDLTNVSIEFFTPSENSIYLDGLKQMTSELLIALENIDRTQI